MFDDVLLQDAAYAAGLFDGEGHICIYFTSSDPRRPKKNSYERYGMRVHIGQSDIEAIEWMKATFGGTVTRSRHKNSYREGHHSRWNWTLNTVRAAAFLRAVLPFLKIKRHEAEIAIAFQASMMVTGRAKLPPSVIEFRQKCFLDIRASRAGRKVKDAAGQ